jgi:hypothetical protein
MRKFLASLLVLTVVLGAFGAAAVKARRKGPLLTASSYGDITILNVKDGRDRAMADRPGIIEVRARANFKNLGHYDGAEMWWSLKVQRPNTWETLWSQDYRHQSFRMGKGDAEIFFSQDLVMPPGDYDVSIAVHKPGNYYDKDGVTLIAKDPPNVSTGWRAVVW